MRGARPPRRRRSLAQFLSPPGLPGAFATDRLQATMAAAAKSSGKSVEEVREERLRSTPAGRLGEPPEFGDACAYLCSAQAGYIAGQSLLIDGGAYPGTL